MKTVGKTPQPFPFPFPPVFPFCFPIFPYFSWKRFTVGLNGKWSRSGWDFPVPFSTLAGAADRRRGGPASTLSPWVFSTVSTPSTFSSGHGAYGSGHTLLTDLVDLATGITDPVSSTAEDAPRRRLPMDGLNGSVMGSAGFCFFIFFIQLTEAVAFKKNHLG